MLSPADFDWEELNLPKFSRWRENMMRLRECQEEPLDIEWFRRGLNEDGINTLLKLVPVNEWWCGNFGGNLVIVICKRVYHPKYPNSLHHTFYRVGVYGNDDMAVDIALPDTEAGKQKALEIFNAIQPFITYDECKALGLDYE